MQHYKEYVGYVLLNELFFLSNDSYPWQPSWIHFLKKNQYTPNSYDIFHLSEVNFSFCSNFFLILYFIQIKYVNGIWLFYIKSVNKILKFMECKNFFALIPSTNIEGTVLVFGGELYIYDNLVSVGKLPDYEANRLLQEMNNASITNINLSKVKCIDGMWFYLLNGKVICISNEKLFCNFKNFQTLTFENRKNMVVKHQNCF